jgi:hypothetical protein
MIVIDRDVRGMPLWLLRDYLVELGGVVTQDEPRYARVAGDGWTAVISRIEDFQIGSLKVGQLHITVDGRADALAQLTPHLEKKLLRAGG